MYLGFVCVVRNVLIMVMLYCVLIFRLWEGGLGLNDNYFCYSLEGLICLLRLRVGM